jgi:hypothetical protein
MIPYIHNDQTIILNFDQPALLRYHRAGGDFDKFFQTKNRIEAVNQFCIAIWAASPKEIRQEIESEEFITSVANIPAENAQQFTQAISQNWIGVKPKATTGTPSPSSALDSSALPNFKTLNTIINKTA